MTEASGSEKEKTPIEDSSPKVDFKDSHINELVAQSARDLAYHSYQSATDLLTNACELYAEKFKEENPILLYYYGNALFKLAVNTSDALGASQAAAPVAQEPEPSSSKDDAESSSDAATKKQRARFQFSGSYGYEQEDTPETEDAAEDDQQEAEDGEEDKSDLEIAWEVLDLARTLFIEKIEALKEGAGEEDAAKGTDVSEKINETEKYLADVYDLLGEVSLESENFSQSVIDLESALELKKKCYDKTSTAISEAHFKLSLAYEFDSETPNSTDKAIHHLEKTIEVVKSQKDEADSSKLKDESLLQDLEIKLDELKQTKKADEDEKARVIEGIFGTPSSSAGASAKAQIVDALVGANDISTLVRKRKAPSQASKGKEKQEKTE